VRDVEARKKPDRRPLPSQAFAGVGDGGVVEMIYMQMGTAPREPRRREAA
jgi:hypothetical protein